MCEEETIMEKGELVLYRPQGGSVAIEVLVENETVWLTQAQMAELFDRTKQGVGKHILNAFNEGELERDSVVKESFTTAEDGKRYKTLHYNLDVIISVGYRVKSTRGVQFRRWATQILKDYLLRGHAICQRFERLEDRVSDTERKIEFFVNAALPPKEGVFYEGSIFDAYAFASALVKNAQKSIILLDNYIDETVLLLLTKRSATVDTLIYTRKITDQLKQDLSKHNAQYAAIIIYESNAFHDRFLIIDGIVYHIGASLKDLGKKLFAFSRMEISSSALLVWSHEPLEQCESSHTS